MIKRVCQRCCHWFTVSRWARNRGTVRYCSEACRKRAERARARARAQPPKENDNDDRPDA